MGLGSIIKFGEGTWDEILATRETLLEERKATRKKAKEAAAAQALEDEAFYDKIIRCIIEGGKLIGVLAAAVIAGAIVSGCQPGRGYHLMELGTRELSPVSEP